MEPEIRTALAMWEAAATNAHGGNARKTPLLITAQLIEAGDKLAGILRANEEDCDAEVRHGPGHQSRTKCELKGEHEVHRAVYMGTEATWRGPVAYTGVFDEPPMAD